MDKKKDKGQPQNQGQEVIFEVRDIEGKGRGLVASRDLKVGECVLDEAPLVVIPGKTVPEYAGVVLFAAWSWFSLGKGVEAWMAWTVLVYVFSGVAVKLGEFIRVCRQVGKLNSDDHDAYFSLHSTADSSGMPYVNTLMIWRSNSLTTSERNPADTTKPAGAIFHKVSLLNHSCAPNGYHEWDPKRRRLTVYTMKPVKKGEEITISYVDVFQTREDRQQELRRLYSFSCTCPSCSLPEEQKEESDARRRRCAELKAAQARRVLSDNKKVGLEEVEELLEVVEKEFGDPCYKADAAWEAHQLTIGSKDRKIARSWAQKAHKLLLAVKGPNHPDTMQAKVMCSQ